MVDAQEIVDEVVAEVRDAREKVQVVHAHVAALSSSRGFEDLVEGDHEVDHSHKLAQVGNALWVLWGAGRVT